MPRWPSHLVSQNYRKKDPLSLLIWFGLCRHLCVIHCILWLSHLSYISMQRMPLCLLPGSGISRWLFSDTFPWGSDHCNNYFSFSGSSLQNSFHKPQVGIRACSKSICIFRLDMYQPHYIHSTFLGSHNLANINNSGGKILSFYKRIRSS